MDITSYTEDGEVSQKIKELIKYCQKRSRNQDLKVKRSGLGNDPPHVICFGLDLTFKTGLSKINLSDCPAPA